jgi:hypothetical protein
LAWWHKDVELQVTKMQVFHFLSNVEEVECGEVPPDISEIDFGIM